MLRLVRQYSVKIREPLTTPEQIRQFLASSTWSPSELLDTRDSPRANSIDEKTVDRLLQLSGLQAHRNDYPQMIKILKEQVRFIDHLHSVEPGNVPEEQHVGKRLTLQDIEQQISNQQQDPSKGETEGSWNPLEHASDSKHGHYIVREGLLKDN